MTTIIAGLLVFSVLVIFHEFGHFKVARWLGVRVERFSIGFGPVVLSRRMGGVQYALSAFPLGGYVKMAGDDPRNRETLRPGDFFAASWWRRVLIALAGPGANFVLAVFLGIALAWVGFSSPDAPNRVGTVAEGSVAAGLGFAPGDVVVALDGEPVDSRADLVLGLLEGPRGESARVDIERAGAPLAITVPREQYETLFDGLTFPYPAVIGDVAIGTPAYSAGLAEGDRITAVDGAAVASWAEMTEFIVASPGREITLTVRRGDRTLLIPVTPMAVEEGGETFGRVGIGAAGEKTFVRRFGPWEGVVVGTQAAVMAVRLTFEGIWTLVTGGASLSQISGPVAIIQASGAAAKAGWDALLNFALYISVALMVFNLLPIPILDGGMVVLSMLEAVRRRPVGEKGLAIYQGIGMAVIGTLLVFVLINDPHRIWKRHTAMDRATEVEQISEEPLGDQ